MSDKADPLYVLLRRSIDDDGPEGDNAWGMFTKRVGDQPGKLYFMTEDYTNPMYFVVKDLEEQLAEAQAEISRLKLAIDSIGLAPKKPKAKSFPWEKYPELELRAFEMRFDEKKPSSEITDYIIQFAPEARDNLTFLNQRFVQGRPSPSFNIAVKAGSEPTDWKELWKIGTREHADGWIQRVMRVGQGWDKFQQDGNVPKDWIKLDPNNFISAKLRKHLRELYHTNGFLPAGKELESLILAAGPKGIKHEELKRHGVSSRRFVELNNQSVIFKDDEQWVHYSFATHYPANSDAALSAFKYGQQQQFVINVDLSEPDSVPA